MGTYQLLMDPSVSFDDVVVKTNVDGVDLLPANIDLSAAEIQLVHEVGREQVLTSKLHPILGRYDVILIDCQLARPAHRQRAHRLRRVIIRWSASTSPCAASRCSRTPSRRSGAGSTRA